MGRVRSIPPPLLALLAVTLIVGFAWTILSAPFNSPDEPEHAARAALTGEGLPTPKGPGRNYSTDQERAIFASGGILLYGRPDLKPPWRAGDDASYRAAAAQIGPEQRRDVNGASVATDNPRQYYLVTSLAYRLGGDFLTRLWAMRALGVAWLVLSVLGAWLLAGEVFRRDRLAQLVAGGFVALQPGLGAISGAVSPDGMLVAACTLSLWLGVRLLRRGWSWGRAGAALAMVAAACAIKTSAFALVPAVLAAVAWTAVRARFPDLRLGRRGTLLAVAGAVAIAAALYALLRVAASTVAPQLSAIVAGPGNPRAFLSYLWQFYLPRPDFLTATPGLTEPRFWTAWIQQGWGQFGALDTTLAPWLYRVLFWSGLVTIAAALVALVRRRRTVDRLVLAFLAVAALSVLLGLHVQEFRVLTFSRIPFLQGRYLLPLIGVGAIVVAAAVHALPRRHRPLAGGAVLAVMLTVSLLAMSTVMVRFYAA